MAKRPPVKDSTAPPKVPRPRRAKPAASVPPPIDSASDAPELIASEAPPPDRIFPGVPDMDAMVLASQSAAAIATDGPNEDAVRVRAYERYLARGGDDGRDFDDWIEAERELRKP